MRGSRTLSISNGLNRRPSVAISKNVPNQIELIKMNPGTDRKLVV